MLVLDSTLKRVRVFLGAAHTTTPLRVVTSWRDITTTAYTPGSTLSSTNGTTPVEVVAAPAASTQRVVDYVNVSNTDTVTHNVTLELFDGTTQFRVCVVSLSAGEFFQYVEGSGISVFNTAGALKTISAGTQNVTSTGWSTNVLANDVTNNNAVANTIADVTGLSFPVVNGTRYNFRFVINYTSAATATGSRWSINGPTTSELRYASTYSLTTTSNTFNTGLDAYNLPAASNATSAATASNLAVIEGFLLPTADGTVIARFASEVANSAIVAKRGSYVTYIAV